MANTHIHTNQSESEARRPSDGVLWQTMNKFTEPAIAIAIAIAIHLHNQWWPFVFPITRFSRQVILCPGADLIPKPLIIS